MWCPGFVWWIVLFIYLLYFFLCKCVSRWWYLSLPSREKNWFGIRKSPKFVEINVSVFFSNVT
jgi:hypothetical protein